MRKKNKERMVKAGVYLIGALFIFSMIGAAIMYSSNVKKTELPLNTHLEESLDDQQKQMLFSHGGSLLRMAIPADCNADCQFAKDKVYEYVEEYAPFVYLYEYDGDAFSLSYENYGTVESYILLDEEATLEIQTNICNNLAPFGRTQAAQKCMMLRAMENY
ncbi:MAG: hypothetical protein DRN66_02825 [Candidatus Nanohalarchaeota archaeon]|nr:MAG: hypothetical protein DRN66_02825 [Candidatus Nanohaloarchaeota archaeon]